MNLVLRVIDGDTIDVDHLNKKFTVRLVSIDAAELGKGKYDQSQPFARAAEKHLTGLVSKWMLCHPTNHQIGDNAQRANEWLGGQNILPVSAGFALGCSLRVNCNFTPQPSMYSRFVI